MIGAITRLDAMNWWRDRRLAGLLITVTIALVMVTAWSTFGDAGQHDAQHAASEAARDQWLGQGDANPHGMAHFGDFAFRPAGPMARLDQGLQARLGKVLFLEGHRQGVPMHTDATRAGSVARFARLDAAFLLQTIVPLLLIFLGATNLASDRESGRLKLTLVQGTSAHGVLVEHFISLLGVALAMLLMVVATSLLTSTLLATNEPLAPGRLALFMLAHTLYFTIIAAGITAATAWLSSARAALLLLLAAWVIATALLPRATAGLAGALYPLPSQDAFQATMSAAREAGPDGHNPQDAELERLRQEMLETHGVETVEELPLNFDGIAMQVDEEFGNQVWDEHFGALREIMSNQVAFGSGLALLNPFQAIDGLSMALAGTDLAHDLAFQQQAEQHRRALVEALNREHAYGGSTSGDWSFTAEAEFFASLSAFEHETPSLQEALRHGGLAWLSLLLWASLLIFALRVGADRLERGTLSC